MTSSILILQPINPWPGTLILLDQQLKLAAIMGRISAAKHQLRYVFYYQNTTCAKAMVPGMNKSSCCQCQLLAQQVKSFPPGENRNIRRVCINSLLHVSMTADALQRSGRPQTASVNFS